MSEEQKPAQFQIIKAGESVGNAIGSNVSEPEDAFKSMYSLTRRPEDPVILQPPYDPYRLARVVQENNMLPSCIEAMVDNVDGTGFTFESKADSEDDGKIEDTQVSNLKEMFDSFVLNDTFLELRKKVRRDLETIGYGCFEVIRNLKGEIALIRYVDAKTVRMVKLDAPVEREMRVFRNGAEMTIRVKVRERRFVQNVGPNSFVYFKEFGGSRGVDAATGRWAAGAGNATELMFFTNKPDATSPYGVPRWVHQIPAALGSRKAEEFNLEFFDNGGVPPVIVFLQGGTMSAVTKGELDKISHGSAMKKNRMMVLELDPTSGSLDNPQQPRVVVERFGADRQSDTMFSKYDAENAEKVRRAFRIAPIFLGQSDDYNFATAYTAYMITEQQVFKPERDAFDVRMNAFMEALGYEDYKFVSLPMTLKNADLVMQTVPLVKELKGVPAEQMIDHINEVAGTRYVYDEAEFNKAEERELEKETRKAQQAMPFDTGQVNNPPAKRTGNPQLTVVNGGKTSISKSEGMYEFVFDLRDALYRQDKEALTKAFSQLASMPENDQEFVRTTMAKMVYAKDEDDLGLNVLAGCGASVLARNVMANGDDD